MSRIAQFAATLVALAAAPAVAQFTSPARLNPGAMPAVRLNRPIPPRPPETLPAARVQAFLRLSAPANTATTPQNNTSAPQPGPTIRLTPAHLEDNSLTDYLMLAVIEHGTIAGPVLSSTPDGAALIDPLNGADVKLAFYGAAKPYLVDCSVDSPVNYTLVGGAGFGGTTTIASGALTPVNGHAMFVVMPLPNQIVATLTSPNSQSWVFYGCEVTPMG